MTLMKYKSALIFLFVFLLISSLFFIGIGFYFNALSNPKRVIISIFDRLQDYSKQMLPSVDDLLVDDTFTFHSSLDFELDSEYYLASSLLSEEDQKIATTLQKLNQSDTSLSFFHDSKGKKAFLEVLEKIDEESNFHAKLLIDNATAYYFKDGILDDYINYGTCNYFEGVHSVHNTSSNIKYLRSFLSRSFEKNLTKVYFSKSEVVEMIQDEEKEVNRITIHLTDIDLRDILNAVLNDLKKDQRSHSILESIYPKFSKFKIKEDFSLLGKDGSLTLHVYTTKILSKPLKYELIFLKGNDRSNYIYEEKDSSSGNLYYLKNDHIFYQFLFSNLKTKPIIIMYNAKKEEVGLLKLEKNKMNHEITYSYHNDHKKLDLVYSSKFLKYHEGENYQNQMKLSIKYIEDKKSMLNGTVTALSDMKNQVKIQEEMNSSVLVSKLSKEQKEALSQKKSFFQTHFQDLYRLVK